MERIHASQTSRLRCTGSLQDMDWNLSSQADNSCWTCRRRRWKCDRTLPTCHKCAAAQQHCLGYGKERPLRWTNSVASRGKLMGKTVPRQANFFSIRRLLVDPDLQDLPVATRGYIAYFEQECCHEFVLDITEPNNSVKELMRLIPSSPGFRHTVVSVAALHQAQRRLTTHSHGHRSFMDVLKGVNIPEISTQLLQVPAYYDALYHKQKTLAFLRDQCSRGRLRNPDEIFASILLSIWFELMDSGKDRWKDHLQGLQKIMQTFNFPRGLAASIPHFSECFDTNYAIFGIIGPTFVKTKLPYQPIFTTIPVIDVLKLSESQTWAGCPAELLFALSLINSASSSQEQTPDLVYHICSLLRKFSPIQWATAGSKTENVMPRYHFARIWRAAVEIYASQVFNAAVEEVDIGLQYPTSSLDSIVSSIGSMDPSNAHYRGLLWPTFVIGAEAQTPAQKSIIVESYGHSWTIWRCENVTNALRLLQRIWALRDVGGVPQRWIEYVYESGEAWMFV